MRLKFVIFILFITVALQAKLFAVTGCSTYQGLYPNSLNTTHSTTGNVYYNNTNYIVYRTYDQDPRCGIRENKVVSQGVPCDVIGVRDYGVLVTYNPADNSCMVNVPLDDHCYLLVIVGVGLGLGATLKKKE